MADDAFVMKTGDTIPPLDAVLVDGAGHAVDLTLAVGVTLHMRPCRSAALPVVFTGEILPAIEGPEPFPCVVRYAWAAPQDLAPGLYDGEWQVAWQSGDVETFPNDRYFLIIIIRELA